MTIFENATIVAVTHLGNGEAGFYRLDVEVKAHYVLSIQINIPDVEEAIASVDIPTYDGRPLSDMISQAVLDRKARESAPSTDTPQ